MSKRYTSEQHEFLRSFIPGHRAAEISAAMKERFGIEMTESAVKAYKANKHINSGTKPGWDKGKSPRAFPEQVARYIEEHHKGVGYQDMADLVNKTFGTNYAGSQMKGFYHNHGLNSGLTGRFQKGHIPANKGKKGMQMHPNAIATQFKKGNVPTRTLPVGTVIKRGDGYLWRKVADPNKWKQEHRIRWEEKHGPIPKGKKLIFLDGDRSNADLDNLQLVDDCVELEMTRRRLWSNDPEMTKTGALIAEINTKVYKRKKERRERNDQIQRGDM